MKFVKLSVLALSMGLLVASCGNGGGEKTETKDTATQQAPPANPPAAPAQTMTPTSDSMNKAAAPAADSMKKDGKKEEPKAK